LRLAVVVVEQYLVADIDLLRSHENQVWLIVDDDNYNFHLTQSTQQFTILLPFIICQQQ